ncbi:hypothetical protein A2769_03155 [Candidatus Daviesbacteria bacterium RIFCSPHIGHO2_01_FULL_37_27]|nr:MAG: hypothetical protein A2769_03155 [Candidatus Daviesbacteria bacterium RIFCSPHIGHO2_01_FULL_37_27]
MKEMKANQFLEIPFPIFPENRKIEIANIYKNIISLHESTREMKERLESIVYNLVVGKEIESPN